MTGQNGEFFYKQGDSVLFTIGGRPIGTLTPFGMPDITPFALLGNGFSVSVSQTEALNLVQVLLGLDTNPGDDHITLPQTIPALPTHFFDPSFDTVLQNAGYPLASAAQAIAHLQTQFAILGSWSTAILPNKLLVITFFPYGTFMSANDDDGLVSGRQDGMERGSYQWNATTHLLTYTITNDTDGTGGLSNPGQTPPYTFTIDSSGNTATLQLGPNISDQIILHRVIDASQQIVGAWKVAGLVEEFTAVLTLLPDGTFTVVSDPDDPDPAGIERGTYSYNPSTGTVAFITTVDTNGNIGVYASSSLPAVSST
jgi:hypothetical protein